MFKLFGLEAKILAAVGTTLEKFQKDIVGRLLAHDQRLSIGSLNVDKIQMELNSRLSRLENLLADELAAKEKARDLLIKRKRLKK